MNDSNNSTSPLIQPLASNSPEPHPLRDWHIMYTILGILIVALFVVGGLQLALYETSPTRGSVAGLAVAISLLHGVIACVAVGAVALVTLPFYIMARKKVAPGMVDVHRKQVRLGLVAAVIVFGSLVAFIGLVASLFIGG